MWKSNLYKSIILEEYKIGQQKTIFHDSNITSTKEYILNHINKQYGTAPIEEPDDAEHEDKEDKRDGQSSISKGVAHRTGENRPEGNHQGDVASIVGKGLFWIQMAHLSFPSQ